MSEKIEISNGLLSAVLGCECEFKEVKSNKIGFTSCDVRKVHTDDNIYINPTNYNWEINLHTFICLAKIWAFENGYEVFGGAKATDTIDILKSEETRSSFTAHYVSGEELFDTNREIEALEWVYNEIKEK